MLSSRAGLPSKAMLSVQPAGSVNASAKVKPAAASIQLT